MSKTLKAIRKSIRKWAKIAAKCGVDEASNNCALCKLFTWCYKCPIGLETDLDACNGTPYYQFCDEATWDDEDDQCDYHAPKRATTKAAVNQAQRMHDYLRYLESEVKGGSYEQEG